VADKRSSQAQQSKGCFRRHLVLFSSTVFPVSVVGRPLDRNYLPPKIFQQMCTAIQPEKSEAVLRTRFDFGQTSRNVLYNKEKGNNGNNERSVCIAKRAQIGAVGSPTYVPSYMGHHDGTPRLPGHRCRRWAGAASKPAELSNTAIVAVFFCLSSFRSVAVDFGCSRPFRKAGFLFRELAQDRAKDRASDKFRSEPRRTTTGPTRKFDTTLRVRFIPGLLRSDMHNYSLMCRRISSRNISILVTRHWLIITYVDGH